MTTKLQILHSHGILVKLTGDTILALDVVYDRTGRDISQWLDVTSYTVSQIYDFLGY